MKKTVISGALVLGLMLPTVASAAVPATSGEQYFTIQPVGLYEAKPLRAIAEKNGFEVKWNNETQTAVVKKGEFHSVISVKDKSYEIDGSVILLDPAPMIKDGKLHVSEAYINQFISSPAGTEEKKDTDISLVEGENKVNVGDEFSVTLPLNPSTGYRYEVDVHQPMDISALVKAQDEFFPEIPEGAVGTPTEKTWVYSAENEGTVYFDFHLYAPGENTKPEKTVRYTVHIEGDKEVKPEMKVLVEGENTVKVGEEFAVNLAVNPSTGYRYEPVVHQPMDIAQLVKLQDEFYAKVPSGMVGTPTEKTWVYSAENEGTVYFDFNLYAPGEDTTPEKTVKFIVHIEK